MHDAILKNKMTFNNSEDDNDNSQCPTQVDIVWNQPSRNFASQPPFREKIG